MKLCHSVWLLCLPVLCAFGQTTIYVATTGSDTDGNGSAGNPYLTISNGVDKAVAGDTVLVNPGVYTQMVNIYITKDITVRGMHAPTGAVITTMYPDVNYSTRCVRVSSAGAVFDGFTLKNGYPQNLFVHQYGCGGGILVEAGLATNCIIRENLGFRGGGVALFNSNAVMRNCWVSNNYASVAGGGMIFGDIYGNYGGASLLDSVVSSNACPLNGGGIYTKSTNGVISNCTIAANYASNSGGSVGGGIYVLGPGMLITDSIISNNISEFGGGGIGIYREGYPIIRDSLIIGNKAKTAGAGIYSYLTSRSGGAMISNCVVKGNQAAAAGTTVIGAGLCDGYTLAETSSGTLAVVNAKIIENGGDRCRFGGGAFIYTHGTASFHNCVISSNSLAYNWSSGGGLLVCTGSASVVVQNCLIADNRITATNGSGGGLFYTGETGVKSGPNPFDARVESCTIAGNSVSNNYGGMNISNNMVVFNCVVASNSASLNYPDMPGDPSYIAPVFYSCSPALTNSGNGNITNAPGFADFAAGDFRLTGGSPCANAGTNQSWMAEAVDLDGRPRINRFFRRTDMGCYEYVPCGILINLR